MMFTIIFPVLNERLRLENGVTRTVEYLRSIAFEDYEIIIVDNGSEDETPQIAEKLCKKYDKVPVVAAPFPDRVTEMLTAQILPSGQEKGSICFGPPAFCVPGRNGHRPGV